MLCNVKCFENKRPLDFVHFLYNNHFISENEIKFKKVDLFGYRSSYII